MKPTKKIEAAVLDVYHKWLHSYLNGDVKTYDSYFDNSFHFIGSTNNEEFLTRKDTTNFFKATAEQLAGKTQLRNETKIVEQFGQLVFITHLFDAWFLNGNDWSFYGRFRFSNILEQNKDGWHFVYQHYSTPDSKAQDGETIGFNQITKENLELRQAIQRRTVELEEKNKELEIEGSLERIRAKALAMTSSEDLLDVVVTLRTEFLKLGHEAHYFWHMMWLPDKYKKAMTSGDGTRIGMVMELPRHIHGKIPLLANWEKSTDPMVIYTMDAESAIDYVDKMITLGDFKQVDPQAPTHDDIRHIGGLTFIMARTTHGEIGYSLPGVVENPPKEDLEILVKFAGAFDLAHRRFLDLQKAEKQRREVEIALALEKVRSRTMGMQRSDELRDTAMLLFQQIEELGINSFACGFNIWDDDKKAATAWMASTYGLQPPFKTNSAEDVYLLFFEAEKRGESLFILEQKGKELEDHYKYLKTIPEIKNLSDAGVSFPTYQIIHCAYFSKGYLMFITLEPVPDAHDIFKRFAKVFEQTYTRFLDLQKAEAQAKEAQIEAALERIRSRTMAMQNSSELAETSIEMFKQMQALGMRPWACGFNIFEKDEKAVTQWMSAVDGGLLTPFTTPLTENPFFIKISEARQRGEELFVMESGGQELEETYTYMFNLPASKKALGDILVSGFEMPKFQISHCAFFSQGYLMFITYEPYPEAYDVFKRFAKVFEQTYTRFLDLQKAEAQAREAQIEAALERVRAQSNAMHKSEDLANVVTAVYEELRLLNSKILRCGIGIINEKLKNVNTWITSDLSSGTSIELSGNEPLSGHPLLDSIFDHWTKQKNLSYVLEGKDLIEYYQTVIKTDFQKHFAKEGLDNANVKQYYHCTMFATGGLFVFESSPISKEQINVLQRFTDAFNRAYTRHQDLQKAEAQAREAQIEAALERVRSRSMAMHKSEELIQVVRILDKEILGLGIEVDGTQIITDFADTEKGVNDWFAREGQDFLEKFHIPYINHSLTERADNEFQKGIDFYTDSYSKDEKNEYFKLLFKYSDFRTYPKKSQDLIYNAPGWSRAIVLSKYSILIFQRFDLKEYSKEEQEIFKRFGKVFEQSYTRFLDLQKAEAQVREAQIEGALERVRSRSLAMHNSEELLAVIEVVSEQLHLLDLKFDTVSFGKNHQESDFKFWLTSSGQPKPVLIQVPFFDSRVLKSVIEAQKKEIDFIADVFTKEENRAWSAHMIQHSALKNFPEQVKDFILNSPGFARSSFLMQHIDLYVGNYRAMPFTDEENAIFKRFAQVFSQAYIRFLDLQKAEVQARESQIELALERVRARTMAMQHSTELNDTSALLFQQIQMLGVPPWSCGFNIWEKEDTVFTSYMGSPDGGILKGYKIPLTEEAAFIHFKESRDRGDKLFIDVLEGNALETHYRYFQTLPGIKEIFEKRAQAGYPIPTFQINHLANFSHGNLMFITYEHCPEAHDIFIRFAKVFEQTYTRFLDLQKAEALARESEIQLALERVRARTMAMQSSEELADTAFVLFEQLRNLGGELWGTGFGLCAENSDKDEFWFANKNGVFPPVVIPNTADPAHKEMYQGWRKKVDFLSIEKSGKALKQHYNYMLSIAEVSPFFQKIMDEGLQLPERQQWNAAYFSKGYLLIITIEPYPDVEILKRFAKVFDQTYTRFLDLKKAEEQAREAKIEAALERVRAQSMAMHKSEELKYVIQTVYDQFVILNINIEHTGFIVDYKENDSMHIWLADKNEVPTEVTIPYFDTAHWNSFIQAKEMGKGFFANLLTFEEKNKFYRELFTHIENVSEKTIEFYMNCPGLAISTVLLDNVGLYIENFEGTPYTEGENNILMRFGKVFQQTYTRFLDLKKAEAQTREAQIEAALEKVRSRTMAMRNSSELAEASNLLDEQVKSLGIQTWGCAFHVYADNVEGDYEWFSSKNGRLPFYKTPREDFFLDFYEKGQRGEKFHVEEFVGAKCQAHYDYLKTIPLAGDSLKAMEESGITLPTYQIDHVAFFKHGYILFITYEPVPEAHDIFKRFAKVFEQTYTRFLDLKKAEAQAREAQIEAALEKVRSRSLEMSKSSEMQNVANEILEQVRAVGLQIDALAMSGVIDNDSEYDIWVGGANSKKPLRIPYNNETQVQREFNKAIKERPEFFAKTYTGKVMKDYFKALMGTGNSFNPEIVAFMKTCTGFTTTLTFMKNSGIQLIRYSQEAFSIEDNAVIVRFGKVFEQAYIRFLDLQKAEEQTILAQQNLIKLQAQKQLAEEALSELQQTQTQLIQSEKMASLGELTAGIAHEIQNPLNFVNNFSEVSKELLEEMQEEIENGDFEEVKAIMNDVIQNLEKINHHGKRADAIVKGMLQHSRSSSGTKEPTDINALADEYLRLAYHGLRAKDKSFNATLETDFDKRIGKVNIMPQDMGRVILNLITNAFYAVNEKKQHNENFKPIVSVSTIKVDNHIRVNVSDNGDGIPQKILDKVFQPFFTTKPTGQGTGLGLSVSYDIVKAHGGNLKVETKEGQGTILSIILPIVPN